MTGNEGVGASAINLGMVCIPARGSTWACVKVIAGCHGPGKDAAMEEKILRLTILAVSITWNYKDSPVHLNSPLGMREKFLRGQVILWWPRVMELNSYTARESGLPHCVPGVPCQLYSANFQHWSISYGSRAWAQD